VVGKRKHERESREKIGYLPTARIVGGMAAAEDDRSFRIESTILT
jgi:hypothetical protein